MVGMKKHEDNHIPITMEPLLLEGKMYSIDGKVYLGEAIGGAIEKHFLGHYCKGEITWPNMRITVELLSVFPVLDQWLEESEQHENPDNV